MLETSKRSLVSRLWSSFVAVVAMGVLSSSVVVGSVHAQEGESTLAPQTLSEECIAQAYEGTVHTMNENDLGLEIEKDCMVQNGYEWYSRRCAFCHGGGGKGGKGPCLTCGKFAYSANTNVAIMTTISVGITNKSLGGQMGAFGTTISGMDIVSIVAWMRAEEARRIAAGEIKDPYSDEDTIVW